jgi:hypothetical protein
MRNAVDVLVEELVGVRALIAFAHFEKTAN